MVTLDGILRNEDDLMSVFFVQAHTETCSFAAVVMPFCT